MRTSLKLTLGLLAVSTLVAGGVVSAQGGGGFGGYFAPHGRGDGGNTTAAQRCDDNITVGECRALMGDPCNDTMTVGECKAALEARHQRMEQARQAQCVAATGNATLCAEHEGRGPPHGGPGHHGPGGPEGRGPPHGGPRGPPPGPRGNATYDDSDEGDA